MKTQEPASGPAQLVEVNPQTALDLAVFAAAVSASDGTEPFSEQTLVEFRKAAKSGQKNVLASFYYGQDRQVLAAFIAVFTPDFSEATLEGAVLPSERGRGLGSRTLEALASYLRKQQPQASYKAWAHRVRGEQGQKLSQRAAHLAEELGLLPVRELRKLALALSPDSRERIATALAASSLAEGLELDTFTPGQDDAAWLELNAAAFASHPEQGSLTQADLDERISSDWFKAAGFFLARDRDSLAGYHWTKIPAGQWLEGEVYAVGISPAWQGKGLGKLLTLTGMNYLAQVEVKGKKLEKIVLYVDAENTPAVLLYESLGFEAETIDMMYSGKIR